MGQPQKSRKVNSNKNMLSYVITEEMYAQVWNLNYILMYEEKYKICEKNAVVRVFYDHFFLAIYNFCVE